MSDSVITIPTDSEAAEVLRFAATHTSPSIPDEMYMKLHLLRALPPKYVNEPITRSVAAALLGVSTEYLAQDACKPKSKLQFVKPTSKVRYRLGDIIKLLMPDP